MKRFAEWSRDVRTDAILLLLMLLLIGHGGSDVTPDSDDEDPIVDELTGTSVDSLENETDRSPTIDPASNVQDSDSGSRRIRHRHRDEAMLNSWLDDTNCTLEAIMHRMTEGNGQLPVMPLPCQSQHLTISRRIAISPRQTRREWTNSYSFSLSTFDRNGSILNATLQFPVSTASAGNWTSLRIAIDVQLIGYQAAVFRGFSSQRFRRKHLPSQLCFRVSAAAVVQSLVRSGSGSLVSNIRVTHGGVIAHSHGDAEEQDRKPVMTVDALRQGPCSPGFWDSIPQGAL